MKPNFISKSGSSYYFTEKGVYRHSNHWGRAANCKWRLVSNGISKDRSKVGYANWCDFYSDNDQEKLYYIEVDYSTQSAQFNHYKSDKFTKDIVLRTTAETTKLIKQIRVLLEETAWSKYLKHESIEVLRKEIIEQLITTNRTLQEIKKDYL
ncbi:hypothetical protein [Flavobacterium sp.]|uniref:hypothetical protein n=1 Tax=Flavobacterium sp. TaxID=239 RepID=UPI00333E6973